jgi:hypothetical protein
MELFEQVGLPGGNVALCRSSWESIRKRVVRDSHIVEIPGFKRVVVASNVLDYCRKNPLSVEKGKSGDSGVKPRRELSHAKFIVKNAAQILLCSTSPPKFGAFGFEDLTPPTPIGTM